MEADRSATAKLSNAAWSGVLVAMGSIALVIAGCSGGGGGGGGATRSPTAPSTLPVVFQYHASTVIDPAVDFDTCTEKQVRFRTHLHFIWNDWEDRRYMVVGAENLFSYTGEVPAGRDLTIALHDPNNCLRGGSIPPFPTTFTPTERGCFKLSRCRKVSASRSDTKAVG